MVVAAHVAGFSSDKKKKKRRHRKKRMEASTKKIEDRGRGGGREYGAEGKEEAEGKGDKKQK